MREREIERTRQGTASSSLSPNKQFLYLKLTDSRARSTPPLILFKETTRRFIFLCLEWETQRVAAAEL